jgi:pimeloyl-ACP methyl ester carboxylesterase
MTDLTWRAEGTGEPVLMIMGLATSALGWRRLLPHVSAGHEAIVFDHRGTGRSPAVTGPSTMEALVDDALSVLDAAGHASAHVLGASMGGMIAQHLALEHRDRVRSLGLICTTPVGSSGRPPWRLLAGTVLRPLLAPSKAAALSAPMLYAARTRAERHDLMAEDLKARMSEPTPARTSWAQIAAIRTHDTRRRLSELAGLPTTVVHGDEDALVPTARGRDLAEQIPDARLVLVPQAGHLLTTDNEPDTAAAVLGHLAWAGEVSARRAA